MVEKRSLNVKKCSRCGSTKPLDAFRPDHRGLHGRRSLCRTCDATYLRNHRRSHEHLAERRREYEREYRSAHPEWDGDKGARRRQRKLTGETCEVTERDLRRLYASPCIYCGSTSRIEADHVIPIARGGRHSIGNLAPACRSCNAAKRDKLITEWRKQRDEGRSH